MKKTTALYFQEIKKFKKLKESTYNEEEITKQGLLYFKTRNRTKRKICNFRKRDFQFTKQESVRGSVRNLKKIIRKTAKKKTTTTTTTTKIRSKTENRRQNRQNI